MVDSYILEDIYNEVLVKRNEQEKSAGCKGLDKYIFLLLSDSIQIWFLITDLNLRFFGLHI